MAWPFIVANASVPLLGIVDTAVIGNTGSVVDLGAIALGALIFSFVYWSFGFLRMGTTGFIARADGAGDKTEVRAIFGRSCLIAVAVGLLLLILQWPVGLLSFQLLYFLQGTYVDSRGFKRSATRVFAFIGGTPISSTTRYCWASNSFVTG